VPAATLSLPPDRAHARTARLVVVAAARRAGLAESDVDDVRLAVGEAVARAVLRHEAADQSAAVEVTITDDGHSFRVMVADQVSAASAPQPDVDQGGFALALLSALAPQVAETQTPTGTALVLTWPLPAMSI
jgi:anti-sigma regulatory factor (Ser/Thr protein kinase)